MNEVDALSAQTGLSGYDVARWTEWLPRLSHVHSAGGLGSAFQTVPKCALGANETDVPGNEANMLLLFTKGTPSLDGRIVNRPFRSPIMRWDAVLLPAGVDSWWASTPQSADGVLHLHLQQSLFARLADDTHRANLVMTPRSRFRDEVVTGVAQMVMAALARPALPSRLVWDTYAMSLVLRLLHLNGTGAKDPPSRGGLTPWQLRQVLDFIQAHLANDIGLDDLAAITRLSTKHFARAFRQSTGMPPHRWLNSQRIERARELLAAGDLPLAEVALVCGFADQSHFTAAFRTATGATPGAFRRQARL